MCLSKVPFRFAFITDPQIGMNSPSGLYSADSDKQRLDVAITYINENEIDFVVFGGDQINDADNKNTDMQLDAIEASLSTLTVPYYGIAGNHDMDDPSQSWKYVERQLPIRFSMSHKNLFMVGINASWIRGAYGGQYQQQEWKYLEADLDRTSDFEGHRFVVMHWPLFNGHPQEDETYWNMPNRRELIDLFHQHKISCVLSGHCHQDIDACWHGIRLITSAGTSLPLQYPEERSFKVFTIFEEGWSVRRVAVDAFKKDVDSG